MASGVRIQQRRPPLYLLTNVTLVVAAHTPFRGRGGKETSLAQPTPKRVPKSAHTNRYLVPGLSFEGGIFNEQQTTFV